MNTKLKNAFDNEASFYDETAEFLLLDYSSTLLTAVESVKLDPAGKYNILDVGCGTGNLLSLLRSRFPNSCLYGVDFSKDMLKVARNKAIDGVEYINIDLFDVEESSLPLMDVVVVSFVFHNFTKVEEHLRALEAIRGMLAVNGQLIIADLIDPKDQIIENKIKKQMIENMRKHGLSDEEVEGWIDVLEKEDNPLSVDENMSNLIKTGYKNVYTRIVSNRANAVFFAQKKADAISVKTELLYYGIQPDSFTNILYETQNPFDIEKTGNNGVFLSIDGLSTLVSVKHRVNVGSPYRLHCSDDGEYSITKNDELVDIEIRPIEFPKWAFTPLVINGHRTNFSDYFVYEGTGFVHLGYDSCSFSDEQKCKFCSVKRRNEVSERTDSEICTALEAVLPHIPDDIHFCIGGGAYFPLSDNVKFFEKIIKKIRDKGKSNPIWVEMIPPELSEIQSLIDAGATSFGFNIEIWNDEKRAEFCPGKSKISVEHYLSACKYVIERLGRNAVGSCIIVGLDTFDSIKKAIDSLLLLGIMPCVLLLKDFDTELQEMVHPYQMIRDYHRLSRYAAKEANKCQVLFNCFEGCLKCNCCTIMHDIQFVMKKGEKG